uniref:ZP domain-containing protein n=1 Tax=Timema shepardi TaxID=629360 RepID=A0A7R9AS07_TIMSH|nr:unnamed protein product [Timema shepardi]
MEPRARGRREVRYSRVRGVGGGEAEEAAELRKEVHASRGGSSCPLGGVPYRQTYGRSGCLLHALTGASSSNLQGSITAPGLILGTESPPDLSMAIAASVVLGDFIQRIIRIIGRTDKSVGLVLSGLPVVWRTVETQDYTTSEGGSGGGSSVELDLGPEQDLGSGSEAVVLRQLVHQELNDTISRTGESLNHEGSEQSSVVFVADGSGYQPITRSRPLRRPEHPDWHVPPLESWDRDYKRHRHNSTRVQQRETHAEPTLYRARVLPGTTEATRAREGKCSVNIMRGDMAGNYRRDKICLTWILAAREVTSNPAYSSNVFFTHIEAECQDDYMKIRIGFNGSFGGLLYSAGYAYDPDCVYINGTGRDYYEFYIQLNRCGTLGKNTHHEDNRKTPTKNFMWNTVTVQYNPLIEEEWDEHFKVTCEYGYDFWKTVTFPFLDVEVATGNPVVFTLSPPECYMEIRNGYGTNGNRVTSAVRVGDPLTLIIYMRSKYDGFDIVVNDCYAHNGATKKIQLIDQYGCPVDDKLISRFRGSWSESGVFETQVFAYMKTFRFTGSPALYIECDVRMCHGRCPSQPCHWRNAKSVSKRSVPTPSSTTAAPKLQSENVNLFQSLRVLQEGEGDAESVSRNSTLADPNSVCLKTGAFTALFGFGCVVLCLLTVVVVVLCCRMRRLNKCEDDVVVMTKDAVTVTGSRFNPTAFMTHKGRIN